MAHTYRHRARSCSPYMHSCLQVAVESSNGDFDLGDPAELQKLVSSDAMPSSPLPPISAGISASMPLQPISAPGAIVPSASLAPPVPAVQVCPSTVVHTAFLHASSGRNGAAVKTGQGQG